MTPTSVASGPDPARVMVVHGRNEVARNVMFAFLSVLGLRPLNWDDAVEETGEGTPHNMTAVRAAMATAQATIVLFTGDEIVRLHPALDPEDVDTHVRRQSRPNVLFEAGMAFATRPSHTIVVEFGRVDGATDLDGHNAVRMDGGVRGRLSLRKRLLALGCAVDERSTEFRDNPPREDFARAIELTAVEPHEPAERSLPLDPTVERRVRIFLDSRRGAAPFDRRMLRNALGQPWDLTASGRLLEQLAAEGRVTREAGGRYRAR